MPSFIQFVSSDFFVCPPRGTFALLNEHRTAFFKKMSLIPSENTSHFFPLNSYSSAIKLYLISLCIVILVYNVKCISLSRLQVLRVESISFLCCITNYLNLSNFKKSPFTICFHGSRIQAWLIEGLCSWSHRLQSRCQLVLVSYLRHCEFIEAIGRIYFL